KTLRKFTMKTLNYSQLSLNQQQEVNQLMATLEGQNPHSQTSVRFIARGNGGEFATSQPFQ
ncbi:hypothetical protein, partial [Microcystis sp. M061S2]|uniref:hypothetical protein n=1 Tax=Microcystis sp. M061S2 TaxID=2771171 RepID=UPI00258DC044